MQQRRLQLKVIKVVKEFSKFSTQLCQLLHPLHPFLYMDYVSYIYSISYKLCISLYIIHQYITITCVCKVLDSIVSIATSPSSLALHLVIKVTPFTVGFINTVFKLEFLTSFSFSTIFSPICLELVFKPIRLICLVSWVSDFKTRKCFLRFPLFKRQHHCKYICSASYNI